ncbi:MAG: helix-turn-helix transcriptional regulator [Gemmatimonadetes bacterium]|nr:helix-turn-helix transcriptional regulator [Gemmatimonadota bacterium]
MATKGGCGCAAPATAAVDRCYCTVDDLVHAIGRKYTLPVLVRIGGGTARFTRLQRALGVSSSTLSETLDDLIRVGLVHRTVLDDRPPSTEYALTAAGKALRERLRPLLERVRAME